MTSKPETDETGKGRTSPEANCFWDEYGQMTKVVCIIAPIQNVIAGSDIFNLKSFLNINARIQFFLIFNL